MHETGEGPKTAVYRPDQRQQFRLICGSAGLACLGWLMYRNEWPGGGAILLLFSACAVVGVLQYSTHCSSLRLSTDGLEVISLFRRRKYRWSDVREFRTQKLGPLECVVIRLGDVTPLVASPAYSAVPWHGVEEAIPDTYGMTAEELARRLNDWREQASRNEHQSILPRCTV